MILITSSLFLSIRCKPISKSCMKKSLQILSKKFSAFNCYLSICPKAIFGVDHSIHSLVKAEKTLKNKDKHLLPEIQSTTLLI